MSTFPTPSMMANESTNQLQRVTVKRIVFCAIAFALAVGLGISIGYTQRTPEFNPTSASKPILNPRILTILTDLVSVDATAGSMTLDWSIVNDTACDPTKEPPCPDINPNSTVDFFFDANILNRNVGDQPSSDNVPETPIFIHNATAVNSVAVRNALAGFRTPLTLMTMVRGRTSLSTLQQYPFDEYNAQIFVFALDSITKELIGLQIGAAHGVAVGFHAAAVRTPHRGYPGVISELITISRSPLVKAYVLIIVIAVWLITLMLLFATVYMICGHGFDISLLLVPVATLFAVTQLRSSMPGAPPGFGAIIDFIGILPCLALIAASASLTIGALVFSRPTESRNKHRAAISRAARRRRSLGFPIFRRRQTSQYQREDSEHGQPTSEVGNSTSTA